MVIINSSLVVRWIKFIIVFDKNVINSPIIQVEMSFQKYQKIISLYNEISYHVSFDNKRERNYFNYFRDVLDFVVAYKID